MKNKILITGAAGLLGSQLAEWILNNTEYEVIGVDDMTGGLDSNWQRTIQYDRYMIHCMDAASDEFSELVKVYKPEVIFHFAAYAAECLSPFIRKYNYQNNLIVTANVINAAINNNVRRVVFTSSMAVYGQNVLPFSEDLPRQPIDPYGVAKTACELDLEIAGRQHGLEYCILRPHNVYGPGQNIFDPYRNVIGIFMYKTMVGDPITIYGDGLQTRAFSYIEDALEPMWKSGFDVSANRQIINIGGTEEVSILEMASVVKSEAEKRGFTAPDIIHLAPRDEVREAYSTYQKSIDILGYTHKTDLEVGIGKMWDWVLKEYPDANYIKRKVWNQYEVDKGIYPYWKTDALENGFWQLPTVVI